MRAAAAAVATAAAAAAAAAVAAAAAAAGARAADAAAGSTAVAAAAAEAAPAAAASAAVLASAVVARASFRAGRSRVLLLLLSAVVDGPKTILVGDFGSGAARKRRSCRGEVDGWENNARSTLVFGAPGVHVTHLRRTGHKERNDMPTPALTKVKREDLYREGRRKETPPQHMLRGFNQERVGKDLPNRRTGLFT
jgi:hypothetical protein